MNWKYIQKLVAIFKSIWEKYIQNRPVYKKLQEEHNNTTAILDEARDSYSTLQAEHEQAKTDLNKARHSLSTLQAEHDDITTDQTKARRDLKKLYERHNITNDNFNKLQEEHNNTTAILDEARDSYSTLQAEHEQTKTDLNKARDRLRELDDVASQYELVSKLLTPQSYKNEEFEEFKKLFETDFMDFANKEFSLAEEASAVQRLQRLEKQLEEVVISPHTFTKKSIGIGGGFSSGKSEFVNSLIIGDVKLPVGLEPTTAIPSFVISSSEISIKGVSRNGATVDIEPEFYTRLSHDFLEKIKNFMPYMTVEVPLVEGLFENICLIDTPGYDPAGEVEDRTIPTDFLKDRDALIWMIPAKAGTIPQEDLEFIHDLELNGVPFYVILSKAELLPENELEKIQNEVKETLEYEGIEYAGISVYSAISVKEYLYDMMSLNEFFDSQNKPVENLRVELRKEIEKVFSMYEEAIYKDEETAKRLNSINLKISELANSNDLDPDDIDILIEEFDKTLKIKNSQGKNFIEIKKEMEEIKKNMLKGVDNVFRSLRPQSVEVAPRSRPDRRLKKRSSRQTKKKSKKKPPFRNPLPPPMRENH